MNNVEAIKLVGDMILAEIDTVHYNGTRRYNAAARRERKAAADLMRALIEREPTEDEVSAAVEPWESEKLLAKIAQEMPKPE